ncbi:MAG: glycosyltransferase family 4 protein [Elusimicrobia bacterium]|nr:glycosyltransferase family 4 protein [Elusimicrobiota bacterium]
MPLIVHIITKLELGGAQQNTLFTMENLPGNLPGILLTGRGGMLDEEAASSEKYLTRFVPFLRRELCPFLDFAALVWMFFYLLPLRADIVHTHSSKAGILGRWAAYFARVPIVIHTFHGFGFTPLQHPLVRKTFVAAERLTAHISDILITVAKANRKKALAENIGPKKRYYLVHSGINPDKFRGRKSEVRESLRESLGLDKDALLVGNVSCFKPQKGLEIFIQAASELARMGNYYFVVFGDGVLRKELESEVLKQGLEKRLFLPGWREDPENLIPGFDIMLHTAHFEGLARVFLEAMASGVPVVATSADGAVDVIRDGYNGFLASQSDVDSLVKYSHNLLNDKKLRQLVAEGAAASFEAGFDIRNMSEKLNALYAEELKKKGKNI